MADWVLTKKDLKNAEIILENERNFPLDRKHMFRAGLYCIISAAENYIKHTKIYNQLLEEELDTPENILNNKKKFANIFKKTRFPNLKIQRAHNFSKYWQETDLPEMILADIVDGREYEFELRNQLAEEAPGLSYKGASFFMMKCGYENIAPLDIWMLRYMKYKGYDVLVPDYETIGNSSWLRRYSDYEREFTKLAKEQGLSPVMLQIALWGKKSTWNNR